MGAPPSRASAVYGRAVLAAAVSEGANTVSAKGPALLAGRWLRPGDHCVLVWQRPEGGKGEDIHWCTL